MDATKFVRVGHVAVSVVLVLCLFTIAALVLDLSPWGAFWCEAQRSALVGIATGLGALAMALTVLLILRQLRIQEEQTRFTYLPAVSLQVDYDPGDSHDRMIDGLPIRFCTANQATVFKLHSFKEGLDRRDPNNWTSNMVRSKGEAQQKEAHNWWNVGVMRAGEDWFGHFGRVSEYPDRLAIVVEWQHVGPEDRWRQRWTLRREEGSGKPPHARWHVESVEHPQRIS